MNDVRHVRPSTVAAAIDEADATPRARYFAGGTNAIDLMKIAVEEPLLIVDVNRLPFAAIERRAGALFIGALARLVDVARNPLVRSAFPMSALALEQSASPLERNMASLGGNVLQRARCTYFRDVATPCNKRSPGSGCGAIGGDNRRHAILGTSPQCIATHASDLAVAFVAADAVVHVSGRAGKRTLALRELYRLPEDTPHIETTLAHGELITGVVLPDSPMAARSTYVKGWLQAARTRLGARVPTAHGLRATNATLALANGAPIEHVSRDLGHADIRTTMKYVDLQKRRENNSALRLPVEL